MPQKKYKKFNNIGNEEIKIVTKVLKSGVLSGFKASKDQSFYGGEYVKKFEKQWCKLVGAKYSIAVNSWTSGLTIALGSINLNPGDEVIVPPWTMSATVMSILQWNAIPVFVDINERTFCIDERKIRDKITNKTKAIICVDIFGLSSNMDEILRISKKYNLKTISDSAQSPLAKYKSKYAGTLADIGGYSFNCHKHIQCGEGGILITNNKTLARKMQLLRNHAEVTLDQRDSLVNMLGGNYRMGEIEAAIMIQQTKKLKKILLKIRKDSEFIIRYLKKIKGIIVPLVPQNQTHSYYVLPLIIDRKFIKEKKDVIYKLLLKENIPSLMKSYQNLHLLPIFSKQIAYGNKSFPWSLNKKKYRYHKGICPVSEELNDKNFLGIEMCKKDFSKKDLLNIIKSFENVFDKLNKNEKNINC